MRNVECITRRAISSGDRGFDEVITDDASVFAGFENKNAHPHVDGWALGHSSERGYSRTTHTFTFDVTPPCNFTGTS